VGVVERRLGECEHEARDDAEIENLPHVTSLYMRSSRDRLAGRANAAEIHNADCEPGNEGSCGLPTVRS
jgi:hypothetical protein